MLLTDLMADVVAVTSDNPRFKNHQTMVDEIMVGASPEAQSIFDRLDAIKPAVAIAKDGDSMVIGREFLAQRTTDVHGAVGR
ncbi:MAG: hypothetical protein WCK06_06295 [Actinomycetota bacterium]